MSYSRWGGKGTGHWYTYWCIQPKDTKETEDNAIFEICGVCSFTAKQLRDDMERCIGIVANKDKTLDLKFKFRHCSNPKACKKDRLDELKGYMDDFLNDIKDKYPEKQSAKTCILCTMIEDSSSIENVNDTCAEIGTTTGKLIVPIVKIERGSIQGLKQAVDKLITKTFEKASELQN